jgi:hypothetical protein
VGRRRHDFEDGLRRIMLLIVRLVGGLPPTGHDVHV